MVSVPSTDASAPKGYRPEWWPFHLAGFSLGKWQGINFFKLVLCHRLISLFSSSRVLMCVRQSARSAPWLDVWLLGPAATGPVFSMCVPNLGVSLCWDCSGTRCLPSVRGRQVLTK